MLIGSQKGFGFNSSFCLTDIATPGKRKQHRIQH
jgi:hypothetical protein